MLIERALAATCLESSVANAALCMGRQPMADDSRRNASSRLFNDQRWRRPFSDAASEHPTHRTLGLLVDGGHRTAVVVPFAHRTVVSAVSHPADAVFRLGGVGRVGSLSKRRVDLQAGDAG